jgi:IMP dehydrogenase
MTALENDLSTINAPTEPNHVGTNDDLFTRFEALTFDDVVVVPAYSEVLPDDVDLRTVFARDIELAIPVVSAAMDRVTESAMAIAMARHGGIGVIHRNLDIESQAAEVERVKRSQSGWITDPVTLGPDATLADAELIMSRFHISGDANDRLLGVLTNRDTRFCTIADGWRSVQEFMTAAPLITAPAGTTLDQAKEILRHNRIEKLPLVSSDGRLLGLITVKDILKATAYPNASRDSQGRLRCAAAVGVGVELEKRVDALVHAGVDAVTIDTAHGHSAGVVQAIRRIRAGWPSLAIVAGNVVTPEGVLALHEAGADAVKVGVGAGSICTTRVVSGAGLPQLSAIHDSSVAARRLGLPLIGDGGITFSGDVVKAIAAGSWTVMLGSMLAGTDESPGEVELFEGRRYKSYRGMGSLAAMTTFSADRYGSGQSSERSNKHVPEGVEGRVPVTGPVGEVLHQLIGGLRSGMGYAGAADQHALRTQARFTRVTAAGRAESHPHDISITKDAPNYPRAR